jgi:alginate O-acetyltransferase complex protein AlgJ
MSAPSFALDPSSREAEAKAEIAATRFGSGARGALVAGLFAALAAGPLFELDALRRGASEVFAPLPSAGGSPLARARAAIAEIESRFDQRSALVAAVRPPTQRLLTGALGQGNARALVGLEGWLFFADDVDALARRAPGPAFAGDPVRSVVAFRDALAARGVELLVVPVPVKPAIHPERLGAEDAAPPLRAPGEPAILERLAERGVELVDLAPRFARQAADAGASEPLYLATDTHWTPAGMELAAREIALRLRAIADLPPGESAACPPAERTVEGAGDLVALLGLDARSFARERVVVRPCSPPAGAAPVVLLGDSFAAVYSSPELGWGAGAGLRERLAALLGLPVDALLRNAGGASATRELLARRLAADPRALDDVRAVVWLFAAREWRQGAWREVALP